MNLFGWEITLNAGVFIFTIVIFKKYFLEVFLCLATTFIPM